MTAAASAEHLRQIVREAFARWRETGSMPIDLLAEDVEWTVTGANPVGGTYRSRAEFVAAIEPLTARLATPITPRGEPELYADGDTVIALFDGAAQARDGEPYENRYSWYMTFRGEEIVRVVAFFDGLQVVDLYERVGPA